MNSGVYAESIGQKLMRPAQSTGSDPCVIPDSPKENSQSRCMPHTHFAAVLESISQEDKDVAQHASPIPLMQLSSQAAAAADNLITQPAPDPPRNVQQEAYQQIPPTIPFSTKNILHSALQAHAVPVCDPPLLPAAPLQGEPVKQPTQECSIKPAEFDVVVDALSTGTAAPDICHYSICSQLCGAQHLLLLLAGAGNMARAETPRTSNHGAAFDYLLSQSPSQAQPTPHGMATLLAHFHCQS